MESILDVQFEQITAWLRGDGALPRRSAVNNASVYGAAPYGIFATADGYLAIAMAPIGQLARLLDCAPLEAFADPALSFARRDDIKALLREHLRTHGTQHWLDLLEPADIWCAQVHNYAELINHPAFAALDMTQRLHTQEGAGLTTLRCPIRIDGAVLKSPRAAPALGEHTQELAAAFALDEHVPEATP
jgi:crotonobetainyl-CoA:carnitine CoA-transferase CaiB-like acyl-CoA transferase